MEKRNVTKYAAYLIPLLLISAGGYYLFQHGVELGLEKPALILKVSTNLTSLGLPMINNVTFEQSSVPFFYKTTDIAPKFPELDVNARINNLASAPASYWASAHYKGDNVYPMTVYFRPGSEPKKDDILILTIRITSTTGAIEYKTTAFYQWE